MPTTTSHVLLEATPPIAELILNDPEKRNALSNAVFDALERRLDELSDHDDVNIVLVRGSGNAFCAGFDLAAGVEDISMLGQFIERLGHATRRLRRLPQVVVAAVHGPAIAGGCALLSACDFVVTAPDVHMGYPVHRIGISPAVTIPTLAAAIGPGPTRSLLMSGRLIDGSEAKRIGLATHLAENAEGVVHATQALCGTLAGHGSHALRTTKAWLNELDGSLNDARFDRPADYSAAQAVDEEARTMLNAFWSSRRSSRS